MVNALESCSTSYDDFNQFFTSILDQYASKKKNRIRGNQKPHIYKTLRKTIALRFKLKDWVYETKDPKDIRMYKKQRNLVASLNKEGKYLCFNNKCRGHTSIILVEKEKLSLWGCLYGDGLARLGGLAHLSEISPSLGNSYKNIKCSYEK